jgi:hypothetical protein
MARAQRYGGLSTPFDDLVAYCLRVGSLIVDLTVLTCMELFVMEFRFSH